MFCDWQGKHCQTPHTSPGRWWGPTTACWRTSSREQGIDSCRVGNHQVERCETTLRANTEIRTTEAQHSWGWKALLGDHSVQIPHSKPGSAEHTEWVIFQASCPTCTSGIWDISNHEKSAARSPDSPKPDFLPHSFYHQIFCSFVPVIFPLSLYSPRSLLCAAPFQILLLLTILQRI